MVRCAYDITAHISGQTDIVSGMKISMLNSINKQKHTNLFVNELNK